MNVQEDLKKELKIIMVDTKNGYKSLDMLRNSTEMGLNEISESDFKIIRKRVLTPHPKKKIF